METTGRKLTKSKAKRIENWGKTFQFFGARKCMVCGIQSELPIYELHHHDQDGKETNVSSIMHHGFTKIAKELRKCILVCSNCHRVLHHVERERKR